MVILTHMVCDYIETLLGYIASNRWSAETWLRKKNIALIVFIFLILSHVAQCYTACVAFVLLVLGFEGPKDF